MKYFIFLVAAVLIFGIKSSAQNNFGCISHDVYNEQMKNDPVFRMNQQKLEKETQEFIKNYASFKPATATYVIPVVFHVIHTGGAGNISNAQIYDQIDILNKEFKRQQPDTALTPWAFKPLAAGFDVEFRLATLDPNGNCTNGINRIYNTLSTCSFIWDDVKALSYWPSNKYLNLWIVESMHYPGNSSCFGGGYSAFPGGPTLKDGVVMRGDLISNIGTAATNSGWGNFKGRYLIHELGHWFNLRHIWGDQTCGNDLVTDTPPAQTSNSGCPSFPHNANNSCGAGPDGEMYTNYMDYTNGPCLNMFTAGQVARMTTAINSPISGRNNLWSPSNLAATGTADPYIYPAPCVAVPEVLPYGTITACEGDSVKFTDYSYSGTSTSRQWDFFGQPASSLTDSIVKVKYSSVGVYNVALTKNYMSSSNTQTFVNKVFIIPGSVNLNYTFPFVDDIENPNFTNEWAIVNKDINFNARTWETFTNTSYSGNTCVGINNFSNIAPAVDDLYSPIYDLSSAGTLTLSFRLHFAARTASDNDNFAVWYTKDCGKTWTNVYYKTPSALKTTTTLITSDYYPAVGGSEWRLEKINLAAHLPFNQVRFKFSFTSGGGNNIFIDDINVDGTTNVGVKENKHSQLAVDVFPNPSNENITIDFKNHSESSFEIEVTDITGKLILREQKPASYSKIILPVKNITAGLYLLSIKKNGKPVTTKKISVTN
ncbi:MAG: hypothetical protein K0S32_829 [Bacteroidetes bacterium]|jgi:hypothetical protein|nr:hypothetical protein [Bacteroidota bacterium]